MREFTLLSRRFWSVWFPVLAAVAVVGLAVVLGTRRLAWKRGCEENLASIYSRLKAFGEDRGNLPALSLFPNDVYTDPDSLYIVLAPYGLHADECVCPALQRHLGDLGIAYIWNVKLNGRAWDELGPGAWMLVEINALSRNVPPPHRGHYHILYADGRVERTPYPPPGL